MSETINGARLVLSRGEARDTGVRSGWLDLGGGSE